MKKPKNAKKKPAKIVPSVPAWQCPKCGATHPIMVGTCCAPLVPPYKPEEPWRRSVPWYCSAMKPREDTKP